MKNLYEALVKANTSIAVTGPTPVFQGSEITRNLLLTEPTTVSVLDGEVAACIAVWSITRPFAEHAWAKLYDRSLLPLLQFPKGRNWEDQFVMYKVLLKAGKVAYEDANDYFYFQHPASLSRIRNDSFFDTLDARAEILEFAKSHGLKQLEKTATKKYHGRVIGIYADLNYLEGGQLTEKAYAIVKENRGGG